MIDKARLPNEAADTLISTSWHEEDRLADAVWFGMYTAFPAPAYADSFGAALYVTVAAPECEAQIASWLSDPQMLNQQLGLNDDEPQLYLQTRKPRRA